MVWFVYFTNYCFSFVAFFESHFYLITSNGLSLMLVVVWISGTSLLIGNDENAHLITRPLP